MKPTQSSNFKAVKLPAPQTTVARCYSVIDIGTVPNIFNGKQDEKNPFARKVQITWELPAFKAVFADDKGPEPFVVGVEFTHVFSDKSNLRKMLVQWMNKDLSKQEWDNFDLGAKCPGKTALISFVHKRKKAFEGKSVEAVTNENTVIKLNTIMQLPEAMKCPPQLNPTLVWDWSIYEAGAPIDMELWKRIPGWLRNKIATSQEYMKLFPKDQQGSQQPETSGSSSGQDDQPDTDAPVDSGSGW